MRSPEAPMRKLRHAVVAAGLALGLVAGIAGSAAAQSDYPSKSVTMIVPFPAGGRTDLVGRMIAQHLSARLGAQIVIVNRPGASSVLGSKEVAQARPDGATLGFFSTSALTAQYTVPTPLSLGHFQPLASRSRPADLSRGRRRPGDRGVPRRVRAEGHAGADHRARRRRPGEDPRRQGTGGPDERQRRRGGLPARRQGGRVRHRARRGVQANHPRPRYDGGAATVTRRALNADVVGALALGVLGGYVVW